MGDGAARLGTAQCSTTTLISKGKQIMTVAPTPPSYLNLDPNLGNLNFSLGSGDSNLKKL